MKNGKSSLSHQIDYRQRPRVQNKNFDCVFTIANFAFTTFVMGKSLGFINHSLCLPMFIPVVS